MLLLLFKKINFSVMFFTTNRLGYKEGRRTSLLTFRLLYAKYLLGFMFYLLAVSTNAQTPSFLETAQTLNVMCRDLMGCTIRKNCVQVCEFYVLFNVQIF